MNNENDLVKLRYQVKRQEEWIKAKCTIGGCWKSLYVVADARLQAIAKQTVKALIADERQRRWNR